MKRYTLFIIITLVITGCASAPAGDQLPRTDGVYRSHSQLTKYGMAYEYLRFYSNGQVVSASIIGTPEQFWVATLKKFKGEGTGQYQVSNGDISFVTRDEYAVIDYRGKMLKNGNLGLSYYSHTTGYKGHSIYSFERIEESHLPAGVRLRGLKLQPDGDIKPQALDK